MERIAPPIASGDRGASVRLLHEVLRALDAPVDDAEVAERTFGQSTEAALRAVQERLGLQLSGVVDDLTALVLNDELGRRGLLDLEPPDVVGGAPALVVLGGTVRTATLVPLEGWQLTLIIRGLRDTQDIGTAVSGTDGAFEFSVTPPPPGARLQVVATDPSQRSTARSAMFRADSTFLIEVEAAVPEVSGYERMLTAVQPLLGGIGVEELVEDDVHQDITFLAGETGYSDDDLTRLTVAHRVETMFGVPASAAFAVLSGELSQNPLNNRLAVADRFSIVDSITHRVGSSLMAMSDSAIRSALNDAVGRGVVAADIPGGIDGVMQTIAERRLQFTLDNPLGTGKSKLRDMLTLAGLDDGAQTTFAKAMVESTSPGGRFWAGLAENSGLAPELVKAARDVAEIGSYTKNHVPLIAALQSDLAAQRITSIRDLAARSPQEWVDYIAAGPPELIPDNVVAATETERQQMLGTEIYERVVRAHPSRALLAEAGRRGTVDETTVNRMIAVCETTDGTEGIDLVRTNIDHAIITDPDRMSVVPPEEQVHVVGELRRHQRAIRIARHPQSAAALLTASLDSAAKITAAGRTQFMDFATAQGMAPFDASTAYRRAEMIEAMVVKTLADFGASQVLVGMEVVPFLEPTPEQKAQLADHPTLRRLFGSQDFCACEACNSAYSPAAYLADLLLWLAHRTQAAGTPVANALAGLLDRRPDLADIKLSCDNTNIEVPYIDLVNELLEDIVAPPTTPTLRQTSGTSRQRRGTPEHVNEKAYEELANARFPLQLPFDRSFDEGRVLLDQLGTSYEELIDVFAPFEAPTAASRSFGLDDVSASLITNANVGDEATMWNATLAELAHVPLLLANASLTFEELEVVVTLPWINGSGTAMRIAGIDDDCDTTKMTVEQLTSERADRLNRFLRLWRHTTWTMVEVDALLGATKVGNGVLDASALHALRTTRIVQDRCRLGVDEALSFYGPLLTRSLDDRPPLYDRAFDPVGPGGAADPALAASAVTDTIVTTKLAQHTSAVAAGLGVTLRDVDRLLELALPSQDEFLTLGTLSALSRWVALSRVIRCSIDELIIWHRLLPEDPFASPMATNRWLDSQAELASFGVSVGDLSALLDPVAPLVGDDVVAKAIDDIRAALAKIAPVDDSVAPQRVVQMIPTVNDQASQARLLQLLTGAGSADASNDAAFVLATVVPVLGSDAAALFVAAPPALTPEQVAAMIAQRVGALSLLLRALAVRNALIDVLSRATGGGADVLRPLISLAMVATPAGVHTPLDVFTALAPDPDTEGTRPLVKTSAANFPDGFAAVRRLAAVVRIALALDLVAADVGWLADRPADDWLTPVNVPAVPGDSVGLEQFVRTARLFVGLRTSTRSGRSWAEIVDLAQDNGVADEDFRARLSGLLAAVTTLSPDRLIGTWDTLATSRVQLAEPLNLVRGAAAAGLVNRVGTSATTLLKWATSKPSLHVTEMWDVARGRYTPDGWLDDLPRFSDPMRERRRDAIVAYLVPRPPSPEAWRDAATMFGYFLLDVGMAACLSTSRIVQAYSSVQLFVTRCLMNRELSLSGVVADATKDDGWLEWAARSQHPIFAANLQIWHYPENWLNQVDRPGKTEGFLELERALSGQDVTEEAVEAALLQYFERLDEVARLRVIGFHDDRTAGVVHVVGRTESAPYHHYYRTQKSGRWSPWTRMDVDIRADTVSMTVFRRRLHVFWATSSIKAQQLASKSDNAAPRYGEVELSWTSLRTGKWSPARKAAELVYVPPPVADLEVGLRLTATGSSLVIDAFSPDHIGQFTYDGRNAYAAMDIVPWNVIAAIVPGARLGRRASLTGPTYLPVPSSDLYWRGNRLIATNSVQDLSFSSAPGQFAPTGPLLRSVAGPFSVLGPAQDAVFDPACPFFFEWQGRTWFVTGRRMYQKGSTWTPEWPSNPLGVPYNIKYEFTRFFYPYADLFFEQLDEGGLKRLYRRPLQWDPNALSLSQTPSFQATFQPVSGTVKWGPDVDTLDYRFNAPDFVYNMEPFVHAVDRVAEELMRAGRPDKALRFLGFILDWTRPNSQQNAGRYWIPRVFAELADGQVYQERINQLLQAVNSHQPVAEAQVKEWRANPFQPFRIADMRATAYMKSIAMKTVKALLACGDRLYQSPSRNNLNQAALYYLTAAEIMGRRPERVSPPELPALSFNELITAPGGLDDFANFAADLENVMPQVVAENPSSSPQAPLPTVKTFYFKVPPNPQLLQYWDILEDRMFKLRNCQDITGGALVLPLLDPPVDPGALARAAAAGIDIADIVANTNAPLPHERFDVMLARADRLAAEVCSLGRDLLAAIEKRDAEALSTLKSSQAVSLAALSREIRQMQIDEAEQQVTAARASLDVVEARRAFNAGQPKTYTGDDIALGLSVVAGVLQVVAAIPKLAATAAAVVPKIEAGVSGWGAHATVSVSGLQLSQATDKFGDVMLLAASVLDRSAAASATMAAHARRYDEHQAVAKQAELEKLQITKNIETLNLVVAIRGKEHQLNEKMAAHDVAVDEYLSAKFSSTALYDHLIDHLSALHFQSYQTAVDLARRAEACFRHELCVADSAYIQFGHWDSLRKGLLAGERLTADLRRLSNAYHDRNTRRLELVKTVSLLAVDPLALLRLKTTGSTNFSLRETAFDADHPGHFQRRIKSVSVSIPCVVGPYNGVHATLRMTAGSTRMNDVAAPGKYGRDDSAGPDIRFHDALPPVRVIATSTGVNDSGLFEANLHDDRYLPFEGGGAISDWHIELPPESNQFDITTVSDVLLEIRYTALPGSTLTRDEALKLVAAERAQAGVRLFNIRREFGGAWEQLFGPGNGPQQLRIPLGPEHVPFSLRGSDVDMSLEFVFVTGADLQVVGAAPLAAAQQQTEPMPGISIARHVAYPARVAVGPLALTLAKSGGGRLGRSDVSDAYMFVTFRAQP